MTPLEARRLGATSIQALTLEQRALLASGEQLDVIVATRQAEEEKELIENHVVEFAKLRERQEEEKKQRQDVKEERLSKAGFSGSLTKGLVNKELEGSDRGVDDSKLDEGNLEQVPAQTKKKHRRRKRKASSEAKFAPTHVLKASQTLTGYTPLTNKSASKRTLHGSNSNSGSDVDDDDVYEDGMSSLVEPITKMRMDLEKEMASLESRQRVLIHHLGKRYGKEVEDEDIQLTVKEKKMLRALTFSNTRRAGREMERGEQTERM